MLLGSARQGLQLPVLSRRQFGGTNFLQHPVGNGRVKIVSTQGSVAPGSQHFKYTAVQAQNRDIERATPQIIYRDNPFFRGIQPVGNRCSGGLIQQA